MTRSAPAIFCIASLAIMTQAAFAEQPADLTGIWLSPKANMRVRVGPCGSALCGYIIWMQHPNDPQTGEPLTDRNNPDPAKRNKPILGLQMITDLKPGRPAGEWNGQVYLPNDGKTSNVGFSMDGPNGLKIEVCRLAGLLCRTQTWTRVN